MKVFRLSLLLTVLGSALGSVLLLPTIAHADDAVKPRQAGRSGESKTIFYRNLNRFNWTCLEPMEPMVKALGEAGWGI